MAQQQQLQVVVAKVLSVTRVTLACLQQTSRGPSHQQQQQQQ
jgi:hypothetical protein